ncbi:hypothetical protein [Peptoniphilus sp.]|uniref:hypothetical protein n=1 Tax=Peptoniphilus sp. TaxID=1971214 RepID=UPI00399308F2
MKKYIRYRDYLAWYEWVEEDKEFHGRVLGVEPIIGLYGDTEESIIEDFKQSIKEYEEEFVNQNRNI